MIQSIFMVLALICFLLAAVRWPPIPLNLVALGLAFWVVVRFH